MICAHFLHPPAPFSFARGRAGRGNRKTKFMAHPYCTQTGGTAGDIMPARISLEQLTRLTCETDDPNDIVQDVIDTAIEDADAVIDGYCAVKYSVPFATIPTRVKTGSAKIATYNLFEKRSAQVGMPDSVRQSYEDEIAFWKDVAKGIASLGIDPPPTQSSATGAKVVGNDRVFTKDSMKNF